ncbi:MAG: hypothetical protein JNK15_14115 [Planctomycetes bacterium]|nr:hypothetical protein [Planctomycetota bacterium]
MTLLLASLFAATAASPLPPATLFVGPLRAITSIGAALAVAGPGDIILVDQGSYPAFTVTLPVTIAGNGGTFSVQPGLTTPAITVSGLLAGTVAIDGAQVTWAGTSAAAIQLLNCGGDIRLQNIGVSATGNLPGMAGRAAIEVTNCTDVILEQVAVLAAGARSGSTTNPDGANNGLSAVRVEDAQTLFRNCFLRGFDAPTGGLFAGDAIRTFDNGAFTPMSLWLNTDFTPGSQQTLVGGNAPSGNGGNCLHRLGGTSLVADFCGPTFFAAGSGGVQTGGAFAWNNDGGLVGPGIQRMVPACVFDMIFPLSAPAVVPTGTTFTVGVDAFAPGGLALLFVSIGSMHLAALPGLNGRVLIDLGTASTIGAAVTPAAFTLTIPPVPSLAGINLTAQAIVNSGTLLVAGTSEARFISIR